MATASAAANGGAPGETTLLYADPKIRAYFTELDNLGDISRAPNNVVVKRPNPGSARVGARPVSGIRGIYFSRGMWKVNFLDDRLSLVTCHFRYDDAISLVRSYHLAHAFLRRVIKLRRHVNEDDGTIIERMTDAKLVKLDRQRHRGGHKHSPEIRPNELTPYDEKQILDNLSYKQVRSKERTKLNGDADYDPDDKKKRKLPPKLANGNGRIGRPRKMTKLQENLLEYSECSALEMLHRVIEENSQAREADHGKIYAARKERRALRRELDKKYGGFGQDAHLNGVNGTTASRSPTSSGSGEAMVKSPVKKEIDTESSPNGTESGSGELGRFVVLSSGDDDFIEIKSYKFDNCFKRTR